MHSLWAIFSAIFAVWFIGGTLYVLFKREPTRPEDARRDEWAVESANVSLAHELGNATSTPRFAAGSSSEDALASEPMPTPRPLSPWLDDSQ